MVQTIISEGIITDEALHEFRNRVGKKLRINHQFNELASKDAIRKFSDGIGDPNPLWRDETYARATVYKTIAAPPSWHNSVLPTWVLQGLAGVHALHTSSDWEFYKPILLNDRITPECRLTKCKVKQSDFAGKSVIEQQEVKYFNQNGELTAKVKSAAFRVERAAARQKGKYSKIQLPHPWTEEEILEIEAQVLNEKIRGAENRFWEDVAAGDELPVLTKGPLGLTDFIAYIIGASPVPIKAHGLSLRDYRRHPAWGFRDPVTFAMEPIYSVHYNAFAAQACGIPYPYDVAVQRHCWLIQLMTNWMSDNGWLKKSYAKYRDIVYLSDVVWLKGTIVRKYMDENSEHCVDIKTDAINQRGRSVMNGQSTVILPSRDRASNPVKKRLGKE
ncbi:MAG: MaoC family dehydratase N-terminal domain-containing protein [Thermodesulfobacteriota bacterium]